jgi:hypothetical protein
MAVTAFGTNDAQTVKIWRGDHVFQIDGDWQVRHYPAAS